MLMVRDGRVDPTSLTTVQSDNPPEISAFVPKKMCIGGCASATMGAMNKRELAKAVAVQADVELKTVITVIDGFTDVVTAVVSKGEPVSIPGFAKFVKVNRAARMGRNPATGEAIRIKASKKARITPVKAFKDAVLAPATAPKLAKGAYPTSEPPSPPRASPPLRQPPRPRPGLPRRHRPAKPRRRARLPPSGRRQSKVAKSTAQARDREEVREGCRQYRSPETGPVLRGPAPMDEPRDDVGAGRSCGRPLPDSSPIGPSRSRIRTGCHRTIPPTRRSSRPTLRPCAPDPTPTSTRAPG